MVQRGGSSASSCQLCQQSAVKSAFVPHASPPLRLACTHHIPSAVGRPASLPTEAKPDVEDLALDELLKDVSPHPMF